VATWGCGVKLHPYLNLATVGGEFHALASLFLERIETQSGYCDRKISAPTRNQNPAVQLAVTAECVYLPADKGKVHPRPGHKGPWGGSRGIALLFP